MKRILITGADSYIGENTRRYLTGYPGRYSTDVLDTRGYEPEPKAFDGYDVVLHVAGIAHIREDRSNRDLVYAVNRDLAIRLARASREGGVNQFITLSSMSVYGMTTGHITKQTSPDPANAYGDAKLQADEAIRSLSDGHFRFVCLRPPMVYGRGCKGNYQRLRRFALTSPVFPDCGNQRSMIYIGNLCEFIRTSIDRERDGLFFPQNEEYVNTSEMVRRIAEQHGRKIIMPPVPWSLLGAVPAATVKKVFGDLTCEKADIVDRYGFEKSIELTEAE